MSISYPKPLDEGANLSDNILHMIIIFHGDNLEASRTALNIVLDKKKNEEILRLDQKQIDVEKINLFLSSKDLFGQTKNIVLSNYFSLTKPIFDKVTKLINASDVDAYIWQDKTLTQAQLKSFPQAKINLFRADNVLYSCLNNVKPKNLSLFLPKYDQVIDKGLYDLFLYLLKGNIRRQLQTFSKFNPENLKKIYLQLIELDYQNKNGQLSIPKEIALKRILTNLLK